MGAFLHHFRSDRKKMEKIFLSPLFREQSVQVTVFFKYEALNSNIPFNDVLLKAYFCIS